MNNTIVPSSSNLEEQIALYKKSLENQIKRNIEIHDLVKHEYQRSISYIEKINVYSLLSKVSLIKEEFSKRFPSTIISEEYVENFCINIYVHSLLVYLSYEFTIFLDNISSFLTDEEYMLINFIPKEKA